ncbi:hypothetical protein ABJ818_004383, partial [Shigella flexneri]
NPQHYRQWNIKQFMQDGGNQTTDDDDQNSKQVNKIPQMPNGYAIA